MIQWQFATFNRSFAGALSNMQQFFESLKENLDSLENLPLEERAALAGKHEQTAGECDCIRRSLYPRTRKHGYRKHGPSLLLACMRPVRRCTLNPTIKHPVACLPATRCFEQCLG